jgi:Cu(I)/Ag(I) efflux system protein CusF
MKCIASLSMLLSLSILFPATAQSAGMGMNGMEMPATDKKNQNAAIAAVGVVKQVDRDKGIVVIAHEPIKSLGWSAMTMDFGVEDMNLFDKLEQGRKVHFEFKIVAEKYVVTVVK